MKRGFVLYLLLALTLPLNVQAKPLVADLSQHDIAIHSGFTGTKLILFGARQSAGDIVVVVRGPARDYTLRKKDRVGGIWVNRDALEIADIPDYYAVASTKPLKEILKPVWKSALKIGIPALPYKADEAEEHFIDAFVAQREEKGLYVQSESAISFLGDTLFKTTLPFPDVTPNGDYTAETYLIHDGQIVGVQSTPLQVAKSGMDARIFTLAHNHPATYGILAVILAMGAGWLASALFSRKV